MAALTKPRPENLAHAVGRMRSQGYSDQQIAGQIRDWHPGWSDTQVSSYVKTQGDMSPSTQPPTAKTKNPDLGMQKPRGAELPTILPTEAPTHVPALQTYGVQQDIGTTNNDVQQIVDAHKKQMGYGPSAGLVFDLLRSKSLLGPSVDWQNLFHRLPASQRDAQATKVSAGDAPYNFHPDNTYVRADGLLVRAYIPSVAAPTTLHALHKEYPTVEAGMLPIPSAESVYTAINQLAGGTDNLQVADLGHTFEEARKLDELRTGSVVKSYEAAYHARTAVKTLVEAQHNLNEMMGTKLPETGIMNTDWQKALSTWMKSRDYFERAAQFQASQAGFKDYGGYLKAFKTKQRLVHDNPAMAHFLNSQPLYAFAHGGSAYQIAKSEALHPFVNPRFDIGYPLHALTRSAGVALDVIGGTVLQGKADAAAGTAFFEAIAPKWVVLGGGIVGKGESLDQAKAKARKALVDNPSWLRIFYPDLPDKPKGALAVVDGITNMAGDLIILRKATFTGETVRAGDVAAATKSTYLPRAVHYAFNEAKAGKIGRAAALLEGGTGAERLAAAATPAIRKGRMTEEQFQQHVAELYAKGHTTIVTLPKEREGVIDVYHGTPHQFEAFDASKSAANQHGKVAYVTDSPEYANAYTGVSQKGAKSVVVEGESPQIRMYRIQSKTIFDLQEAPEDYRARISGLEKPKNVTVMPSLEGNAEHSLKAPPPATITKTKKKVLDALTPEERQVIPTLESVSWDGIKDNKDLYDFLAVMGSAIEHDAGVAGEARTYGRAFANDVLQRLGFTGVKDGRKEYAIFNPEKHLLPRFEKPIEVQVNGPVLDSLRTKGLNTPSNLRLALRVNVRNAIDEFDKGLRESAIPGTNSAADFTSWLRSTFSHVAPRSPRAYFDPRLPERVHDFVLKHFGSAELANEYESALVRARATGNVPRIQRLEGRLQSAYYRKYTLGPGSPIEDDPFSPLLESEAGSRFHFPAGNRQPIENPFDAITTTAEGINSAFNKVAGKFRRVLIISPSLFYKHAVGDTLRRVVGGDSDIFGVGLKEQKKIIGNLINANPELARRWGTFLDRTTNSEVYYMAEPGERNRSFTTADHFGDKGFMRGAGRSLRQMLDDSALNAYRKSTVEDMTPLVTLIEKNPVYQRLWHAAQRARAEQVFGKEGFAKSTVPGAKADMMKTVMPIERYAEDIFNRYKNVEEAAQAKGTSLEDARTVLRDNRGGNADAALGKWISDNRVDYHVKSALVVPSHNLDTISQSVVKGIMSPNKKNRELMAKAIAASTFRDLRAAGWNAEDALHTAMSVAEKQTVYHLLDFSNMLQAEQDLRWLVFFGTKHRLYWKWVASTLVRQPGSAALISDVQQHLDAKGNFNFELFGHKLLIPAARLVWVPGKEYPETSPIAGGIAAFLAGGFDLRAGANALAGPLSTGLQRNVVPVGMLIKLVRMDMGNLPATYDEAASGLDPTNATYLRRAINHFQMDYFADHGHYAPESQAVKHALLQQAAENAWRSNLPLPVIGQNPNDTQKLLDQYMSISDPTKRSKFLDDHPELALSFGVSSNPADYTHLRTYWSRFTQALDARTAVREQIYQQALKTGHMTPELETLRHKADTQFSKILDALKKEDLAATDITRQKEVNGENLGLWGQQLAVDPLTDPASVMKKLYPNLKASELKNGLPSHLVKDAQRELDLLNDPAWVAKTFDSPDEARTRKRELLQFIQDFRNYPKDALAKVENAYLVNHVNTYWKKVEAFNAQINKMGRGDKDTAYAKLRAWKDSQDKPVTIGGITFPSPIAAAWANLPPDVYKQRVAALATGSWDHLADYEKKLLGYDTGKGVSQGWETYTESIRAYHQQYPGQNLAPNQVVYLVNAIDKQNPGFVKDYKFSKLAKITQFEKLAPYKEMPAAVRSLWDNEIAPNARVVAAAYATKNYRSAELNQTWESYVKSDIMPFVSQHPALKRWLQPYLDANPDFLNSLPR